MKTAVMALLFLAVGVLSVIVYSQSAALREQRRQVQELRARLELRSKSASLELQEKCAKQAYEAFKLSEPSTLNFWGKNEMADFANHYNEKLNKCFVQIEGIDAKTIPGTILTFKTVSDAYEGKV
jgi:Tfp pilus assembly protein PilV